MIARHTYLFSGPLILLFLYASISKMLDFQIFKDQISEIPVLKQFPSAAAVSVIGMELLTTFLLAIPKWRLSGYYISLALLIPFTGYIVLTVAQESGMSCACGGLIEHLSFTQHILFNSFFILLTSLGIKREKRNQQDKVHALSSM
jgi:hypothetical protein